MTTEEKFNAASSAYLRHLTRSPLSRLAWTVWDRCWGPILLLVATAAFTIGLCAAEVPDRLLVGICAVESGTEWRGVGDVRGKWTRGADGEASPFQLSLAALSDMGVTNINRVHRDTVYAESLTRLWLSRLYRKHGNWPDSLAAYNAGSRYRSKTAREYASRVLNIATTTN